MNKFLCCLTGGHRYSDANLISIYLPDKKELRFINPCAKCGKAYTITIPEESLLIGLVKDGKTVLKNKKGEIVAFRCSSCGQNPKYAVNSDFCPNCGADMRKRA